MTVVFSVASKNCVLMAADSAVSLDFGSSREYETGRKLYHVEGVGFVGTWGARNANAIGRFLASNWSHSDGRTVNDLARAVHAWLIGEYKPDVIGVGDVGYHVAGFLPDGSPALHHSFWNVPGDASSRGSYTHQMIGPNGDITQFLYNGRHDLAERVVGALLNEIRTGKDTKFSPKSNGGLLYLGHLIMRFASELTPEVGPPFVVRLMLPTGASLVRRLEMSPVPAIEEWEEWCAQLSPA